MKHVGQRLGILLDKLVLLIKKNQNMKKLILMLVAIVAMSFASCTGTSTQASTETDSTAVDTVLSDSIAEDSVDTIAAHK